MSGARAEGRRQGLSVFVRRLRLEAEIGLHPHERGRRQPLDVTIELWLTPGRIEKIADTLDYDLIVGWAKSLADEGHIDLVETYAERLAERCLLRPRVRRARVRVEKPDAVADAVGAGCEVELTGAAEDSEGELL